MASKKPRKRSPTKRKTKRATSGPARKCGLCGGTKNLTRTECCGNWICDDEHTYVLFSYARNSCSRNHRRYTLCAYHFTEGHDGHWKNCEKCRSDFNPEMYVYYATNEYNFEVLENPPEFEPTTCAKCGARIVLSEGGFSSGRDGYLCYKCTVAKHPGAFDSFK